MQLCENVAKEQNLQKQILGKSLTCAEIARMGTAFVRSPADLFGIKNTMPQQFCAPTNKTTTMEQSLRRESRTLTWKPKKDIQRTHAH